MVTSATYQQASGLTPALVERDPQNVLLARGPRFRLRGRTDSRRDAGDQRIRLSENRRTERLSAAAAGRQFRKGLYGPSLMDTSTGEGPLPPRTVIRLPSARPLTPCTAAL